MTDLVGLLADQRISGLRSYAAGSHDRIHCPKCEGGRSREKSLSITIDGDGEGATWICHRGTCGWTDGVHVGRPHGDRPAQPRPAPPKPPPRRPVAPANKPQPEWMWRFFDDRRIGSRTVDAFGIYAGQRSYGKDDQGRWSPPEDVIVFPYLSGGRLANHKYRTLDKRFQQDPQAEHTLYNVDRIDPEEVVVVEGEMDVLALFECGIEGAVSLKDGASRDPNAREGRRFEALETHKEILDGVKRFTLAGDMDEVGLAQRAKLADRLGAARCWVADWPGGCKDAAEVLATLGPDVVLAALKAARPYRLNGGGGHGPQPGPEPSPKPGALIFRPAEIPDPRTIPPRPWLYGRLLIRGFVTIMVAPGGTGKSILSMAVGAELASGRKLLGERIYERVNVMLCNMEDPKDEMDRRLAALMIHHGIGRGELFGRLFMRSASEPRLVIAKRTASGGAIEYPDEPALIEQIRAHNIGLLTVDPYAESHDLEENSNDDMVAVGAAWRRVAVATNCALWLVHHTRKGTAGSGEVNVDANRGASGIAASSRVQRQLVGMTKAEGQGFDIEEREHYRYVRMGDAKRNLSPAIEAKWYRIASVDLENATPLYPDGDSVGAIEAWEPPNQLRGMSDGAVSDLFDRIDQGMEDGEPYSPSRQGGSNRWVGFLLVEVYNFTPAEASSRVKSWLRSGALEAYEYVMKTRGKHPRQAVRSGPISKRPHMEPAPAPEPAPGQRGNGGERPF